MKNLLSYGDCRITATFRGQHTPEEEAEAVPFADRYRYMKSADIIISATASPHYTVTRALMEENQVPSAPRLFVDLAVPRDIDDCVLEMPGAVLLTIDDFEKMAEQNNRIKKRELQTAEDILLEEINELRKELAFHDFYPEFAARKDQIPKEVEQFIYRYRKEADADEFDSFLKVLTRMGGGSGLSGDGTDGEAI